MDKYPIGFVRGFKPHETITDNWHKTDGSLLSISDYSELFSVIGSKFGGDGNTTFALPLFESPSLSGLSVSDREHVITTFAIKVKD